jgi:hypothetical protein
MFAVAILACLAAGTTTAYPLMVVVSTFTTNDCSDTPTNITAHSGDCSPFYVNATLQGSIVATCQDLYPVGMSSDVYVNVSASATCLDSTHSSRISDVNTTVLPRPAATGPAVCTPISVPKAGTLYVRVACTNVTVGSGCFSSHDTVVLDSGATVQYSSLQIGDRVLSASSSGDLFYDKVFRITHHDHAEEMDFLAITTSDGKTLELTASHMLHIGRCQWKWLHA